MSREFLIWDLMVTLDDGVLMGKIQDGSHLAWFPI